MLIGLTGRIGAGKTTLAHYIIRDYGFGKLSFVERILAPRLEAQGKSVNRQNLQEIGARLVREHGDITLTEWLVEDADLRQNWIIDDIRYPSTAEYLRRKFTGGFALIGIHAEQSVRYKRIKRRAREQVNSFQEFLRLDNALTERGIGGVMAMAEYTIDNSGTLGELRRACDTIMREVLK